MRNSKQSVLVLQLLLNARTSSLESERINPAATRGDSGSVCDPTLPTVIGSGEGGILDVLILIFGISGCEECGPAAGGACVVGLSGGGPVDGLRGGMPPC